MRRRTYYDPSSLQNGLHDTIEHIQDQAAGKREAEDIEFLSDDVGVVLTDRTTGDKYRLYVDNGTLQIEVVS